MFRVQYNLSCENMFGRGSLNPTLPQGVGLYDSSRLFKGSAQKPLELLGKYLVIFEHLFESEWYLL